jgi:hypothetical protein
MLSVTYDIRDLALDSQCTCRTTTPTSNHATIPDGLRWLETLVADYRKILLNEPFYHIATTATTIRDFAWARQLLHHSTKFPEVLALRRDLNYDHPYASRYRNSSGNMSWKKKATPTC